MSVADEFRQFRDNYVISAEKIASISYRYKRITRQLNKDFWNTESDISHSLYVGSYGRDTAAKGISDLDIAFSLPASLYEQYKAYQGNGQSALLQAVKRSIQKTYSTSESFGDGQVVVINFDDGITFEILPVFNHKDGTSFIYPNSNGGGSWQVCNPRAEIVAVYARSAATNRNLKLLCRMMRIWKANCSVPISGMLIDTLAYQFIENYEHRGKSYLYHDLMVRDFFEYIANQSKTQTHWRAPGSASYVARTGSFENKARAAYNLAIEAVTHDQNDRDYSRRFKWREIFGTLYPNS